MKIFKKAEVFHVGSLPRRPKPIKRRRSQFSLEGAGLSVSEHPMAWMKIARLGGGEIYDLRREDGAPGLFLDVTGNPLKLVRLAVGSGLIAPTSAWGISHFDEELGEEMQELFASRDDAEAEAEEYGVEVEEVPTFAATRELQSKWSRDFSAGLPSFGEVTTSIAILYAAEATMPDIDGAWWKEKLDPDGFSAPRGVIFKSRLDKWIAQPTDYDWGDDDPDE